MAKNTDQSTDKRLKNLKPAWKEGETGNPNGRPVGQRNYATIYREALQLLADKNATTPEKLEAEMIANGAMLARKGDYRFYKDVLDRIHGTALQKAEMEVTLIKPLATIDELRQDDSNKKNSEPNKEN